ncbi:MAG: hypothetical protein NZ933_09070 [Bacteroidia bacterium]|nr:hypothetical protein [Bacteroidia bacterium]
MTRRRLLIGGIFGGLIGVLHTLGIYIIEKQPLPNPYSFEIVDFQAYIIPTINWLYNGSYEYPISPAQEQQLPPPIRRIWEHIKSKDLVACVPHHGYAPGNMVFCIPAVLLTHILNLSPKEFGYTLFFMRFLLTLSSSVILGLIAVIVGRGKPLAIILLPLAIGTPPLVLADPAVAMALAALLLFLIYAPRQSWLGMGLAVLFGTIAFFMKFRVSPFLITLPIVWVLAYGLKRYSFLLIFSIIYFPFQAMWTLHVHAYTCRWTLTDPSSAYAPTLCQGEEPLCWKPQHYGYVYIAALQLEATLGIPHPISFNPASFISCLHLRKWPDCISCISLLPNWTLETDSVRKRWINFMKSYSLQLDTTLSAQERLYHARTAYNEALLLKKYLEETYWWLPLYRGFRVIYHNLFNILRLGLDPSASRNRFPKWVKDAYAAYTTIYMASAYILGFLVSLHLLLRLAAGKLDRTQRIHYFGLAAYGFSLIVAPLITGHSEPRYFFHSAPVLMILSVVYLSELWISKKHRPQQSSDYPREG